MLLQLVALVLFIGSELVVVTECIHRRELLVIHSRWWQLQASVDIVLVVMVGAAGHPHARGVHAGEPLIIQVLVVYMQTGWIQNYTSKGYKAGVRGCCRILSWWRQFRLQINILNFKNLINTMFF